MPGLHAPCGQRGNSRRRCWCSGLISKQHNLEEGSYFFAFFSRVGAKVVGFFFSLVFWFFVCAFWGCFCAFSWVFLRRFRAGRVFFFARVSADFPSSSSSKPHHTETGGPRSTPFFFFRKKVRKANAVARRHTVQRENPSPENPDATSSSGAPAQKPVIINFRQKTPAEWRFSLGGAGRLDRV